MHKPMGVVENPINAGFRHSFAWPEFLHFLSPSNYEDERHEVISQMQELTFRVVSLKQVPAMITIVTRETRLWRIFERISG